MRIHGIWRCLWADEAGLVVSAEAVLVGTIGLLGVTAGLGALRESIKDELTETAFAFRSLDQSYSFRETSGCRAWTAGSEFIQPAVEGSIADLSAQIERMEAEAAERQSDLENRWEQERARASEQEQELEHREAERGRRLEQQERRELRRREAEQRDGSPRRSGDREQRQSEPSAD